MHAGSRRSRAPPSLPPTPTLTPAPPPPPTPARRAQAFWMCMSVLEGGIYFDELVGLPSRHLALLMAGLVLALLGALLMGIAGFVAGARWAAGVLGCGQGARLRSAHAAGGRAMPAAQRLGRLCSFAGPCCRPSPCAACPHRARLPAEKPEHVLLYAAADSELAAAEGGGLMSPRPPRAVEVLVEKLHAASGRIDRLSSPVLRPTSGSGAAAAAKNGFIVVGGSGGGGTGGGGGAEPDKRWWQGEGVTQVRPMRCCLVSAFAVECAAGRPGELGGRGCPAQVVCSQAAAKRQSACPRCPSRRSLQVHAVAAHPSSLSLELPALGLGGSGSPAGLSPRSLARMEAVRSPTQQLLSRENSGSQVDLLGRALHTAFDRALQERDAGAAAAAAGGAGPPQETILLDTLSSPKAGVLQRR